MIINMEQRFGFIHIPKCAGSTVRLQLSALDDAQGAFYGHHDHPELGRIQYGHIPLPVLAEHFPEEFAKLEQIDVFAICREPKSRFRSAVEQHFREHVGELVQKTGSSEVHAEIDRIVRHVTENPVMPASEFIHFTRQRDFLDHAGKRIVGNVFPIERMQDFADAITNRLGIPFDAGIKTNQTLKFKNEKLGGFAYKVNATLSKIIPGQTYVAMKKFIIPMLTNKPAPEASAPSVFDSTEISDFVTMHYADDIRLHAKLLEHVENRAVA